MRQIIVDTETTGLEPTQGHRIIEIGCVEIINRRLTGNHYHQYLQPDRGIDDAAIEVHGITSEFLAGKPRFPEIVDDFMNFINGAELVIHNAPFDIGFLNHELRLCGTEWQNIADYCSVVDTLTLARTLHPGQKNSLDALCRRYDIDNSQRTLHGALLDAEILADLYLVITGGQSSLLLDGVADQASGQGEAVRRLAKDRPVLKVIAASNHEIELHKQRLATISQGNGGKCMWEELES